MSEIKENLPKINQALKRRLQDINVNLKLDEEDVPDKDKSPSTPDTPKMITHILFHNYGYLSFFHDWSEILSLYDNESDEEESSKKQKIAR